MKAAWYEQQGAAAQVLVVGAMSPPAAGTGEVRIRVAASGINPGDVQKRADSFGVGMAHPRVIPHSDGAGVIDAVGEGVAAARVGERVWCFGAQSYRPFGTAAEYVVVPSDQAIPLGENVAFDQGACLGIPGITAHRGVHVAGAVAGRVVLVQGGTGSVGQAAIALARHAGATVVATVGAEGDGMIAEQAGAHHIVATKGLSAAEIVNRIQPYHVDHIIEVAFDANVAIDEQVLSQGGSIATYATGSSAPTIPFWPLLFKNISLFFLGSDDFSTEAKQEAAEALNEALAGGWRGFDIKERFALEQIAAAHEAIEGRRVVGRVVLSF